jgi:hypothetical protein
MQTFVILRRHAWRTPGDLAESADRSARVGVAMAEDIRWIRSYVVRESDGSLATVCIYQGTSEEIIREHARKTGMRVDEVLPVIDTVIVRPDPAAVQDAA